MFCLLRAPKSLTALNTCLNVFSTFIYTDVSHNHFFFLSCIGFFDQWLIGGLLQIRWLCGYKMCWEMPCLEMIYLLLYTCSYCKLAINASYMYVNINKK